MDTIETSAAASSRSGRDGRTLQAGRRPFFVVMAILLAIIVGVGFAPTFYLSGVIRHETPQSQAAPMPGYVAWHGIALTLWYLTLLAQTLLVQARRVRTHRALGAFGAVLAMGVLALSLLVNLRAAPRFAAAGLTGERVTIPIIGNFGILLLFATLVSAALWLRKKPDIHKRLMLIASVGLVAPAIARWPGAEAALPLSVVIPQLVAIIAIVVYDMRTMRRVHKATIWGGIAYLIAMLVSVPLALSPVGPRIIEALR